MFLNRAATVREWFLSGRSPLPYGRGSETTVLPHAFSVPADKNAPAPQVLAVMF